MKKFFSLLIATVASSIMLSATAFAATNLTMTVEPKEVKPGDTVTVTLSVGNISAATFAAGIQFDTAEFECVSYAGPNATYPEYIYLMNPANPFNPMALATIQPTVAGANSNGALGATWSGASDVNYTGGLIYTAVLKAKVATDDAKIYAFETLDSATNNELDVNLDGVAGRGYAITESVKIADDEPVTPPAPAADVTVSAKTDAEAAWEAETGKNAVYWGVDFADGKFPGSAKATFTAGEDKRELNITYDESFNIGGEVSFAVYVIADETITDVVTMALEAAGCTVQYN